MVRLLPSLFGFCGHVTHTSVAPMVPPLSDYPRESETLLQASHQMVWEIHGLGLVGIEYPGQSVSQVLRVGTDQ